MRCSPCTLLLGTLLACSGPADLPQPLDGVWTLDSASPGVPPRTMTLSQRGASITGAGAAMGVDVPIPISITGAYSSRTAVSPPLVALIFRFENGGGMTAQFNGTVADPDRITGSVVYYGITSDPQPGTLAFTRQ